LRELLARDLPNPPGEHRQTATVHVAIPAFAEEVRCTIDVREPTADSPRYETPISVSLPARIRTRSVVRGEPWGFVADVTLEAPRAGDS
ncbi:MAG: chitobiase/beta-hexosaminidase C-terminal domain-containing protein, partial [Gemmatimonadota bacterium]